jgi:hypothetical protein
MAFRPADVMCVCIARMVRDGEVLAQGLATPLVAAGYLLAWRMHAPHVYFASAIGQSVCREGLRSAGASKIRAARVARSMDRFGRRRDVALHPAEGVLPPRPGGCFAIQQCRHRP